MKFQDAVTQCLQDKAFVEAYDRLNGTNLSNRLTPIENAIDIATKKRDIELLGFIAFVDCFIWSPAVLRNQKKLADKE